MRGIDVPAHTRGAAPFVDDLPAPAGLLHAAPVPSPVPHGRLLGIDASRALAIDGVVAVLDASHIPGENQIGAIIQDEPLLASGEVHYLGQPVALVVAGSRWTAHQAASLVDVRVEELPPILDPREAAARGSLITASRTFAIGDTEAAFASADVIVEGRADSAGQEHLYMETQAALATPQAGGRLHIYSSTQAPTAAQRIIAKVLDRQMSSIEVEVHRLGGAFGGKEDQATAWAALAALAAERLGRPVKLVLGRHDDMRMTGKRHPYSSDFRMGLLADGTIVAYEVVLYQNAGAAADLSPAILGRSLTHATNAYLVPNARITAHCCRTNLPPFTAFRGFGAPQAMFVMEAAITLAADALGVRREQIQRRNLLSEGDRFPYGQQVERAAARRSWDEAATRFGLEALLAEIAEHNRHDRLRPRGLAVMPVCFGISFTNTTLNQASALIHVYTDGSVAISTAAVEMGQGVNTKILGIAAATLGIAPERLRIESTSTARVANTSPTAASSGADLNGAATEIACTTIAERLRRVAADELKAEPEQVSISGGEVLVGGERPTPALDWDRLVGLAYTRRVDLSAHAHFATPSIHFDRATESGRPFSYHVFGTAIVEATLDRLRGTYTIDRVSMVHDAGRSLNRVIDQGQVEGGLVQGIGWMTMEELVYQDGRNRSDMLSTYKVPDLLSVPEMEVVFLSDADNPAAVLQSKAIGEPPLMYGIGAYFALLDAMRAARPDLEPFFEAPMTPERVLLGLARPSRQPAARDRAGAQAETTTEPSPLPREPVTTAAE